VGPDGRGPAKAGRQLLECEIEFPVAVVGGCGEPEPRAVPAWYSRTAGFEGRRGMATPLERSLL